MQNHLHRNECCRICAQMSSYTDIYCVWNENLGRKPDCQELLVISQIKSGLYNKLLFFRLDYERIVQMA